MPLAGTEGGLPRKPQSVSRLGRLILLGPFLPTRSLKLVPSLDQYSNLTSRPVSGRPMWRDLQRENKHFS